MGRRAGCCCCCPRLKGVARKREGGCARLKGVAREAAGGLYTAFWGARQEAVVMGQNQSSEGVASEGKARKDTASASRRAGKSSPLGSSLSKHGKGSREPSLRSIQWAEQVATDMEHPRGMTTNASNIKKPRVRTRGEEGECEEDTHRTLMSTDGENSIVLDEDEEISEFELLIVQELKLRVARGAKDPRSPRVKNLNSVLKKFPQIKAGFEDMRGIFTGVDADGSGDIDFEEWREALAANGLCVPEAHKLQVWRDADVDGNNLIDFKEFVVAMSFLYLMHYVGLDEQTTLDLSASSQAKRLSLHEKVKTAIDLVVNAFLFFDT